MADQTKKYGSLETYRKTDVMTANRETILLMMYAGAIRFLKRAIEAGEKKDLEEKCKFIGKTQGIITELRSTLNFEVGGEIARTLDTLYGYISQRLMESNKPDGSDGLQEALGIISGLNEAWEQAINSLRKEKAKV